jgi:hypothetical protein
MGPLRALIGPPKGLVGPLKGPDGAPYGPRWGPFRAPMGPIWAQLFVNDFLILFSSMNHKPHLPLPFPGFFLSGTLSGTPWALLGTLPGPLLGTPRPRNP